MAKRGRKPKSDYEKYLTAYKKAAAAEMTVKSSYKGMAESAFTEAEFNTMIRFYDGNTMEAKIKSAVKAQRYASSDKEYEGRKLLLSEYNLKDSLKDLRRMTHQQFVTKYQAELNDLYHTFADDPDIAPLAVKKLIATDIFGSP